MQDKVSIDSCCYEIKLAVHHVYDAEVPFSLKAIAWSGGNCSLKLEAIKPLYIWFPCDSTSHWRYVRFYECLLYICIYERSVVGNLLLTLDKHIWYHKPVQLVKKVMSYYSNSYTVISGHFQLESKSLTILAYLRAISHCEFTSSWLISLSRFHSLGHWLFSIAFKISPATLHGR